MELLIYPLLCPRTQRRMRRRWRRKKNGIVQPYRYRPQRRLVYRLMAETGLSEPGVRNQIKDERLYLLREEWGVNAISRADL
ncbi:hypothetical protein H6G36_29215 [Anabaena minutissima FACHB-250]|nr:hypothetical protein [Anabaena minutissima FACHB-250]